MAGASHITTLSNRHVPVSYHDTEGVLRLEQMSSTITVRIPSHVVQWLDETARKTGVPKGRIVRDELEKARKSENQPFLRLAGSVAGPSTLSRKGFSRK
jgi:predicted DNA binding CopG/RHH family protein